MNNEPINAQLSIPLRDNGWTEVDITAGSLNLGMVYVVLVTRYSARNSKCSDEYLCAIRYDPGQTGSINTHSTASSIEDAFKFQILAAAEQAAVFVGGRVVEVNTIHQGD